MDRTMVLAGMSLETSSGIQDNGSCGEKSARRQSSTQRTSLMHIHCPHCRSPIEVVEDQELRDVTCPSCGSSFNLLPDETVTRVAREHKTLGHFELIDRIGIGAFRGSLDRARHGTGPHGGRSSCHAKASSLLRKRRASCAKLAPPHASTIRGSWPCTRWAKPMISCSSSAIMCAA